MRNRPEGIDVSNRNGKFAWEDWNGRIEFAMAKATEGPLPNEPGTDHFLDQQFARNWDMMLALKIHRFAYHFGHPSHDPSAQARFFVDTVKSQGLHSADNFVLDLEVNDDMHPVDVSFWGYVFCEEVQRLTGHAHRMCVYTYPAFAEEGNCAKLYARPLWIANYDVPKPHVPPPWKRATFWQDVGSGLDRDVFMRGSEKDLEDFCGH